MPSAREQGVLNEVQIEDALTEVDGWEHKAGRLVRTYSFPTFMDGIEFVGEVARIAEGMHHHPDMTITHRKIKFQLWTTKFNGITPLDFELARKINALGLEKGVG